jgi:hypothetical protein
MLEGKFGNCQVDEVLLTIVQGKGTGRLNLEGTSIFGARSIAELREKAEFIRIRAPYPV